MNSTDLERYITNLNSYGGNTGIFNQTGQPAISLPLHWTPEGLPMGAQRSAAFGNDALLFSLSGQIEEAKPWKDTNAPLHA